MRVLFTADVYAPTLKGGQELIVETLATRLAARGHDVAVATLRVAATERKELRGGVRVHRMRGLDLTDHVGLQSSWAAGWIPWLLRLVAEFQADLIVANNLFYCTTPGALLVARLARVPCMLALQLNSPSTIGGLSGRLAVAYEQTLGRLMIALATHVVCAGPSVRRHFLSLGGNPLKETTILNGVDLTTFVPPSSSDAEQIVLFAGRLIANKGPDTFVEAARKVRHHQPKAQFWLAGEGPMRPKLERMAAGFPNIRFLGLRHDIPTLMRRARVFVRPSTLEGLPLAILEAMASGVPVVATDIPGNTDLVRHGLTGYLVRTGDAEGTSGAVVSLLEQEEQRLRMGAEARRWVESNCSWNTIADQFEATASRIACSKVGFRTFSNTPKKGLDGTAGAG